MIEGPPLSEILMQRDSLNAAIICGSRHWSDYSAIVRCVDSLPKGTLVIHGGARGADEQAGEAAFAFRLPTLVMPAQWDLFGPKAGPMRNKAMVTVLASLGQCGYSIRLYAFLQSNAENRGTRNCLRQAVAKGIPVIEHWS